MFQTGFSYFLRKGRWCIFTAAVLSLWSGSTLAADCGGYFSVSKTTTGTLTSPNYPAAYPNYTRCIWLLEAEAEYRVKVIINFEGQKFDSACTDYIELRDGSLTSNLLFTSCSELSSYDVISTARWLWFFFASDGAVATSGLSATYSAVYAGSSINNYTNPTAECRSHQFECSNKECISTSYRCDGYEDCGCGGGCDEDACGGLDLSYFARMAMGIGIGIGLFVMICFLSLLLERRHNWAHISINKDNDKKDKQKK